MCYIENPADEKIKMMNYDINKVFNFPHPSPPQFSFIKTVTSQTKATCARILNIQNISFIYFFRAVSEGSESLADSSI